jgi:predicted metal-dependent hydrolase
MQRSTRQLRIDGREVELRVRQSARAQRARIWVGPRRPLEIVVPERMSEREIDRVIASHRDWIAEKAAWAQSLSQRRQALGLDRPGVVWLAGEPVSIERREGGRSVAGLSGDRLLVGGPSEGAEAAIGRWYRREARRRLSVATSREAEALGVRPARISIRDPRTRWGSCSSGGGISYSWRLVLCPSAVLDYVVVHELCHLRVHNHSSAFWGLLSGARPDWRKHAAWLREHSLEIGDYTPRLNG